MKKILFRKLLSDYLSFFLITLIASSTVVWVFQAVSFLDIMIEDGRDYLVYISYTLLNFPKILSKIYPFILFFSLFYVTTKYELNNELLIFWNFGVNKTQLINFILKLSIIFMLFQLLLTSYIVPKSQDTARSFVRNSKVNFLENFIKPKIFNDTIKGVTIYSENKDSNGFLYNLFLKREIDSNNFEITYAKKGIFKQIDDNPLLVLFDGETITGKNNEITNFSFSKSDFSLKNVITNTTTYKKTQELTTQDLIKCINSIYDLKFNKIKNENKKIKNCTKRNLDNILKEFYKRLIIPWYIPILSLLPFILIISSKESTNYNRLRVTTFILGLILVIFSEATIRLISSPLIQNILIIIIPIFLFCFLYSSFIFKFNLRQKK